MATTTFSGGTMPCAVRLRTAATLGVCFAGLVGSVPPGHARGDDLALVDEVKGAWAAQAAEIQSARVRVRHINKPAKVRTTEWPAVEAAIAQLDAVEARGDDDATRAAVVQCARTIFGPSIKDEWPILTIVVDGQSVRNTVDRLDQRAMDWNYGKGTSSTYMANFKEAHVESGRSEFYRYDVSYLRLVPASGVDWQIVPPMAADHFTVEHREPEYAVQVVVDRKTKLARRISVRPNSLQVQGAFAEYAGGVIAPGYGIALRFSDGKVNEIEAFVVEHAEFNSAVRPEELSVSVPAGTRVHDLRDPRHKVVGTATQGGDPVVIADRFSGTGYFSPERFMLFAIVLVAGVALAIAGARRWLHRTVK